ncbi:MAG: RNA-binding S4 domain-containing protein [Muribaculaceae bacterium]|nr:RNA-binding S4 domain-containing protein [Muribaculaceae bacterium]
MKTEERIDKWLWCMRVFKTRTIATDACKKGRVSIGGVVMKPSRMVRPGDVIDVKKPPITYSFRVKQIAPNRLGAKLVPEYLENVTSPSQYELLEMTKISGFVDRRKGLGRPTKRDSRDLSRFKEDTYADSFYLDWEDDDELEDDD